MQGTKRSGEGGRRACYVTPDLSYDYPVGTQKKRAKIINGMAKKGDTTNYYGKNLSRAFWRLFF